MNKDELKELGETLIGISRGEPWQFDYLNRGWETPIKGKDPRAFIFGGYKIRLKPWQLTDSINGHTLPPGRKWHLSDFTEDMLPPPYRPLMDGESMADGDEYGDDYKIDGTMKWKSFKGMRGSSDHMRTTRPIPVPPVLTPEQVADGWIEWHGGPCPVEPESVVEYRVRGASGHLEWKAVAKAIAWEHHNSPGDVIAYKPDPYGHLRQAKAEGKAIQIRMGNGEWRDCTGTPVFGSPPECYRVKDTTDAPQKLPEMPLDREVGEAAVKWWDHYIKENPGPVGCSLLQAFGAGYKAAAKLSRKTK